nr:MAG: putative RNA-dependent RNA polymerase [Picobirnavirus sp.]
MSKFETNGQIASRQLSNEQWNDLFDLPNSGLRAYFGRVREGQPDEYRTPFFKGKSLESILSGWDEYINQLESKWPGLVQFEYDLRSKVGPMSIMLPLEQRLSDIRSYYDSILLESKPIDQKAIRALVDEWESLRGGLRLRTQPNTIANMRLSTNSGNPYFMKRSQAIKKMDFPVQVCDTYEQDATLWTQRFYHHNEWDICAILGWRGQEGGPEKDDVKQRVIWMFPFAVNILELQLYQPLISSIQKRGYVPAWVSMDAVDKRITKLFDTKGSGDLVICTDFSKFDQHFNHDMQECAKEVLTQFGVEETWLHCVYPIKYRIPLAIDWKTVVYGDHGMASGSGGTNADETITHRCLQHEAAMRVGKELNLNSQCLGDDGILSYPGCTVEDVLSSYTAHGQEMNPDKQSASSQECVYLRRWHHKDYRVNGVCAGVYSTFRALGRLAEQERYYDPEKWSAKMVALRQLSIIENVKYHPLREEFVAYCMKGDRYRLGLDLPGFLDNIESVAKEATDYMPDFLGYTKTLQANDQPVSGIKNWWIVKYLKNKKA